MKRSHPKRRDLFGKAALPELAHGEDADRIARALRRLSEDCYQSRLIRSASLAEVAALMVELEGKDKNRDAEGG